MQGLFNIINVPLGYVIKFIAEIFSGNFAAAVFVFTLLINLVLIPLNIKSQKSTVQQTRIKPKLDELKKRYGDDRQKYSAAMQELYQKENVSMSGGCLPMILRLVLMMSIYWLILSPLTYMVGADKTNVTNVTNAVSQSMSEMEKNDKEKYKEIAEELSWNKNSTRNELVVVGLIREHSDLIDDILNKEQYAKIEKDLNAIIKADEKADINFELFGIDLTQTPKFSWHFMNFQMIWLIPIGAFLAQMLTSVLSAMVQKKANPDAPNMMGMMLTMPLISLFIGFGLPGGVGFYWICSSLIGGFIQLGIQTFYGPFRLLSRERAKELNERCDFEKKQLLKLGENSAEQE